MRRTKGWMGCGPLVAAGVFWWLAMGLVGCGGEEKFDGYLGMMDRDTTWEGEVRVKGNLTVAAKLTIKPCTTIRLARGAIIRVRYAGVIESVGREDCPIRFGRMNWWRIRSRMICRGMGLIGTGGR